MNSDDDVSIPAGMVVIPVGSQVLRVARSLAPNADDPAVLDGTRVWLRRSGKQLVVHVGDVDPSTLD